MAVRAVCPNVVARVAGVVMWPAPLGASFGVSTVWFKARRNPATKNGPVRGPCFRSCPASVRLACSDASRPCPSVADRMWLVIPPAVHLSTGVAVSAGVGWSWEGWADKDEVDEW